MNYCELFFIQVFFLSGQSTPKKRLTAKRLVGCHRVSSGVFYKLAFTFEARHLSDFKYKKMYRREKLFFNSLTIVRYCLTTWLNCLFKQV